MSRKDEFGLRTVLLVGALFLVLGVPAILAVWDGRPDIAVGSLLVWLVLPAIGWLAWWRYGWKGVFAVLWAVVLIQAGVRVWLARERLSQVSAPETVTAPQ